ncbi:hypothetical protein BABINDRAFT_161094 [Babjeviella inositovora NRRL Y-12698]|uniref:Uncharacterized protein n=1 Tax=Babjeviella inositovora NRRL Y-12698 TaxID=984486 RepID=A0A1E3QRI1_9ASCO|nr:uncharacterized protein BABINDRAFT_161094 [Babjeviella inositovora NRRL Y-12698]ODQ80104.1 hypothetical protein BABINDRAFT_161094 [Babjeviella inositovora NRRL Y-12698]
MLHSLIRALPLRILRTHLQRMLTCLRELREKKSLFSSSFSTNDFDDQFLMDVEAKKNVVNKNLNPDSNPTDSILESIFAELNVELAGGKAHVPQESEILVLDTLRLQNRARTRRTPPNVPPTGFSDTSFTREPKKKAKAAIPAFDFTEIDEQRQQLLVFKAAVSDHAVIASVGDMKPVKPKVSQMRYEQLEMDLNAAYSLVQLRGYMALQPVSPYGYKKTFSKTKLVEFIIKRVWNVEASDEISYLDDLIIERTLKFSKRDLFFLLSEKGRYIHAMSHKGAQIVVSDDLKLILRGPENLLNYIDINLGYLLNTVQRETLDLTELNKLCEMHGKRLDVGRLQAKYDVYFEQALGESVEKSPRKSLDKPLSISVSTSSLALESPPTTHLAGPSLLYNVWFLNRDLLDRMKRQVLLSLDYNPTAVKHLTVPDLAPLRFYEYNNKSVLPHVHRDMCWYTLKSTTKKKTVSADEYFSQEALRELTSFTDKIPSYSAFSEAYESQNYTEDHTSETLPKSVNSHDMELALDTEVGQVEESDGVHTDAGTSESISLPQSTKNRLYDTLTSFIPNPETRTVPLAQWEDPVMSVSFGALLFAEKTPKARSVFSTKPADAIAVDNYIFNTTIPKIYAKVHQLPLVSESSAESEGARLALKSAAAFARVKLVPEAYSNAANFQQYPPLEVWLPISNLGKIYWKGIQVLASVAENEHYVSGQAAATNVTDMKFGCYVVGKLADGKFAAPTEEGEAEESESGLSEEERTILHAMGVKDQAKSEDEIGLLSPRSPFLASQKALKEYLIHSFKSHEKQTRDPVFSSAPIAINYPTEDPTKTVPVPYIFVGASYGQTMSFVFNGRYVDCNVITRDSLGGRHFEVNMLMPLAARAEARDDGCVIPVDRAEFDRFVDDAVALATL